MPADHRDAVKRLALSLAAAKGSLIGRADEEAVDTRPGPSGPRPMRLQVAIAFALTRTLFGLAWTTAAIVAGIAAVITG